MKNTELRIGNVFKEKYSGDLLVVSELTENRITFDYQTNEKWQSEPIELTEEILLKCGFENTFHSTNKDCFYHKELDFIIFLKSFIRNINYPYIDVLRGESIRIDFLHQLQNLVFVLKGEELEINL